MAKTYSVDLDDNQEEGVLAAVLFIQAQTLDQDPDAATNGNPDYPADDDAYVQKVMSRAAQSYYNNLVSPGG